MNLPNRRPAIDLVPYAQLDIVARLFGYLKGMAYIATVRGETLKARSLAEQARELYFAFTVEV